MEKSMDSFFDFTLSNDQENAFQRVQDFTHSKDNRAFILTGYAGTGKTTLVKGIVKWLESKGVDFQLTASTGRAAKVLSDSISTKGDKNENKVITVHSLIYKFANLSEDLEKMHETMSNPKVDSVGQISLNFALKTPPENEKTVYLIDEASMIGNKKRYSDSFADFGSGKLLNDLIQFDPNGKFIFIGDNYQLPPVGEKLSPALDKNYLEQQFGLSVIKSELHNIHRQSQENGIIACSMNIRKCYNHYQKLINVDLYVRGYKNIVLHPNPISLINKYLETIDINSIDESVAVCHTNRQCTDINKYVRSKLFPGQNRVQIGDRLLITQNNQKAQLVNGDIVKVSHIGTSEVRCNITFLSVTVTELHKNIEHKVLLIEDILYSGKVNIDEKKHRDLYLDYYRRMLSRGVTQKDPFFVDNLNDDPYLNALKGVFGYALTCHKTQGGEWKEVFLYQDHHILSIPSPEIYKWWYTAITRAKNNLHLVADGFIK